jgi:hypothetical protein
VQCVAKCMAQLGSSEGKQLMSQWSVLALRSAAWGAM